MGRKTKLHFLQESTGKQKMRKVKVLLPLIEEYFGSKVAAAFKRLFSLYVKTEYKFKFPDKDEATLAIEDAIKIIKAARSMTKTEEEVNRMGIKNG